MSYLRPLLATDLSEYASRAARMAAHVAAPEANGLALTVLQRPALPRGVPREVADEVLQAAQLQSRDARRAVEEWLADLGLRGWQAAARIDEGVSSAIVAEAERVGADVVLVGERGTDRVRRALVGSVARSVLHRSRADVLVGRARANAPLRRILLATDLQRPGAHAARRASLIAKRTGAEVTLLHAIDPGLWARTASPGPERGREEADWLEKSLHDALGAFAREHLGGRAREVVVRGRAAPSVVHAAKDEHADLVVVGSHGGGTVARVVLGSVADAVAERAPCSVLVVRNAP